MSLSRVHAVSVALVLALVGCVSEAPPTTTPPPVNNGMPALAYVTTDVRDDVTFSARNNGDGMAQPGESLQLVIKLRNSGTVTTTGVRAVVTSLNTCAVVAPEFADLGYGDAPLHEIISPQNGAAFHVVLNDTCAGQPTVDLQIKITDDMAREWFQNVQISLSPGPAALLGLLSFTLDDSVVFSPVNNGDGKAQPGESLRLSVKIKNTGSFNALGVDAMLVSNTPCATVAPEFATFDYGDVAVDAITGPTGGGVYHVTLGASCAAVPMVSLELRITDNNVGSWTSALPIGVAPVTGAHVMVLTHTVDDAAAYA